MPYELSTFQLPGGSGCIQVDWRGIASQEDADALLKQVQAAPLRGLPVLVTTGKLEAMTPGARSVFSGRSETTDPYWMALVVTNPVIRVTSNFIMRITRNRRHRMFATEPEAIQWLDERAREDAAKGKETPDAL